MATVPRQAQIDHEGFEHLFADRRVSRAERRRNCYPVSGRLAVVGSQEVAEEPEDIAESAKQVMAAAGRNFLRMIHAHPVAEPPKEARRTEIEIVPADMDVALPAWKPAAAYVYRSYDPFHALNPGLVHATTEYIKAAMDQADILRPTRDPDLTYLSINRSAKGKKPTLLTTMVRATDAGIDDWVSHLPDAERLRPVANPWSDVPTIIYDKGEGLVEVPQTRALQALVGGAGDGRAVREREAWERFVVGRQIAQVELPDRTFTVTSLGTGTGEPAMDTAIAAIENFQDSTTDYKIRVNGYDVNANSLAIAQHIASQKSESLEFIPGIANILSAEGIEQVVGGTQAHVYEAIGFAEYVPSDNAPTEMEQAQRRTMERARCLSAQDFYRKIYEHMPEGSVLVTGNMRDDSPQASFVIDGLGWKGIIQRSTEDYLRILKEAGIPGQAVELFVPDREQSAAVYNLVVVTKLPENES